MNILLVKLGALGDVLRTKSLLPSIIDKWPNSKITFLSKHDSKHLLNNDPLINRIILYDSKELKNLKKEKFDLVINLDEDFEACSIASSVNSKQIKGFFLKNGKVSHTSGANEWFNMSFIGSKTPKVKGEDKNDYLKKINKKTYQELMCKIIGSDPSKCYPYQNLIPYQKNLAKTFSRRNNISSSDLVIGLNTGSGGRWPSKVLNVDKTAKLAELLHKNLKAKLILFGGPNEIERNNQIIAKAKVPIINSGSGNNLKEFIALMSICDLVVTSDSLGMHIALSLRRKVVTFFGPTSAAEIELFGLGNKIISKSKCYCCYKSDCTADQKYSVNEIYNSVKSLLNNKITIVITAFKEPLLNKAIESVLNQKIDYDYELLVSVPDKESIQVVKKYSKKYKQVKLFNDPGKGKSFALNMIFEKLSKSNSEILIFTDGDVILEKNSINNFARKFKDPLVGCVTGRVVSLNSRNDKLGFWSHLLADVGAHNTRIKLDQKEKFIECSGYLFGFRNNSVVSKIPLDVAEDAIIPYMFWKKGFRIRYAPTSIVYVKNPTNFNDWIKQRKRTTKAHESLTKYAPDFPKVKSFANESKGVFKIFGYPSSLKEFLWTLQLIYARLYMWGTVFYDTKLKNKHYADAWERSESTKI